MKKIFLILVGISILSLCIILISAARLPIVGGDSDGWGSILNDYLSKIAGSNATTLNQTMVNGTNIYDSSINTTHLIDGTITDVDISDTINLTLGQKITFNLEEVIDNIVDGWIRITGHLKIEGNANITGNLTADYLIGDGSQLMNLPIVEGNITTYDTGWLKIYNNNWTNVHLGSDNSTSDSNVTHNLNAPLSDLYVKVLIK